MTVYPRPTSILGERGERGGLNPLRQKIQDPTKTKYILAIFNSFLRHSMSGGSNHTNLPHEINPDKG